MTRQLSLFFLLITTLCFSQRIPKKAEKIRVRAYELSEDTFGVMAVGDTFLLDSIAITVSRRNHVIYCHTAFEKSNTKLDIKLVFDKEALIMASVTEPAPGGAEEVYRETIFYYEKSKLFYTDTRYTLLPCLAYPPDFNMIKDFGYNQYITTQFLEGFIPLLQAKLTKQ